MTSRSRRWPYPLLAVLVLLAGFVAWNYRPRAEPPPVPGHGAVSTERAPWVVALASAADPPVKHCVGTLVAPSVVVTASHCVMNREPADLTVIAGRTDLRTRDGVEVPAADLWEVPGAFDGNRLLGGLSGPVAAAPDLGMVLLAEPLAQPTLPLDTAGDATPGAAAVFYGWRVDPADLPVLWQSPVVVLDDRECAAIARAVRLTFPVPVRHGYVYDRADYLCAAGTPAPGPGVPNPPYRPTDSGAPVVVSGRLAGVNAWGPDPDPATPNYHARVATHAAELQRLIDRASVTGRFTG
ncbi:trypsin-like serine protease [Pseudonocardia sp. NPDC046786]|uniref:S1 family peptidase n=1 Tax=Pseudonocardia sp. NPDC046786 TaxID=3155471 RepID=UPI0034020033